MNFTERMFEESTRAAKTRYWLISDLQQRDPVFAERYFTEAIRDFKSLALNIDGVCYLGDAAEGIDLPKLEAMISMQTALLESLGVPIFYVMGNHELDYYHYARANSLKPYIPFYEAVRNRPLWHCVPRVSDFWFAHETPFFTMLFFSDHASEDGSWAASHQFLPKDAAYPYKRSDFEAVRDSFADNGKAVFTFSHCAFPGGNRPSEFLEQLLPLPRNFRAHFHGHAHIGDAAWAGENLYRQIACTVNSPVMQYDISSLDHLRGTTVRSAVFDYYGDGEYGVFFRDHMNHLWETACVSSHDTESSGVPERFTVPAQK